MEAKAQVVVQWQMLTHAGTHRMTDPDHTQGSTERRAGVGRARERVRDLGQQQAQERGWEEEGRERGAEPRQQQRE